ncbi:MAG: ATP-binding cassette domain-containing protein [Chloroflexi bacterium]|nr:ATP-binding cassette domain-containing protein [Chloroflexota bacterium]
MDALLELRDVRRSFGGVRAVDGIDGRLDEGRILGLIGPNGSGKTTLLGLISATMPVSAGEIVLDGRSMRGWSPSDAARAGICRAYQIPQAMPELTTLENAMLGAMFGRHRLPTADARRVAADALERVGLAGRISTPVGSLSLAERKSLELARVMAARPRLALVDEAMAGLAAAQIRAAEDILRGLRQDGVTVIVVEHVPGVVAAIADEVCVLDQGRVLRWASPAEIMSDPAVIATYLGRRARPDA